MRSCSHTERRSLNIFREKKTFRRKIIEKNVSYILEGQVPVFTSPRKRVAHFYLQALSSRS
jgi:hypothetical protein